MAEMTKWPLIIFALIGAGCASSRDCDLSSELHARAGEGATDCGYASVAEPTTAVDACIVAAFNERRAFFARYDRQGIDSKIVSGIAGDASGKVTFLLWDGDPSGGSHAHPTISGSVCVDPAVASTAQEDPYAVGPLACASSESLGHTCR
jgi:hypothetical protein